MTEKTQISRERTFFRISEWAALLTVMIYIWGKFLESTTFRFVFTDRYHTAVYALLVVTGSVRFIAFQYTEYREAEDQRRKLFSALKSFLIPACFVPFFLVAGQFNYPFLAYLPWLALSLYGTEGDRALKALTVSIGILFLSAVLCALAGAIPNYLYIGKRGLRGSYGICYPTDFASYLVFLLLYVWCVQKEHDVFSTVLFAALGILAAYISYIYAASDTGTIMGFVITAVVLLERLEAWLLRREKKTIVGIADKLKICAFPLTCFFSIGALLLYGQGNGLAVKLDSWISSRLNLTWQYFRKYGINAFGALTPQIGAGGGDFPSGAYEFIDNTYYLLLIRYGWILTIVVAGVWVWMTWKMLKTGRRRLALAMTVIAFAAFPEHHFPEINYNFLLALPLCCFPLLTEGKGKTAEEQKEDRIRDKGAVWISRITAACLIAAGLLMLPRILSAARAFFAESARHSGTANYTALLVSVFFLILLYGLWKLITKVILCLRAKERISARILGGTAAVLCAFAGGIILVHGQIDQARNRTVNRVAADQKPMETVLSAATEPVYAGDNIEEIYRKAYPEIAFRIGSPEEIYRDGRGTIILDKDQEAVKLIDKGALYAEISEESGLYTFDDAVAQALRDAGYAVHGYYSSAQDVKLADMAKCSSTKLTDEGTIALGGDNSALVYGPYMDQYSGQYLATYRITLESEIPENDPILCSVRITGNFGQDVYGVKEIHAGEFDGNGCVEISIPYELKNNTSQIEFPVYAWNDARLTVEQITWRRNPSTDIHKKCYADGLVAREMYYTLEGEPQVQSAGHYGIAYEYNHRNRQATLIRYLDAGGNPTVISGGYAQIVRKYNDRNLIAEEQYLDENGQPVLCSQKYAIVHWEYDNNRNMIFQSFYDTEDKPTRNSSGYAAVRREYDRERLIKESYYDTDGDPTLNSRGYASLSIEYDSYGNMIEESYYDCSGVLTNQLDGYAQNIRVYDADKHIISQRFLDKNRDPVVVFTGYAEVYRTYDDNGRLIKEEYYGADGQPLVQSAGHVAIEQDWDEDKLVVRRYLDMNGSPITRIDGYSEAVWTVSESRRDVHLVSSEGYDRTFEHLNLAKDITTDLDGWSQWMIPIPNRLNSTFNIGSVNLGEKLDGDLYTCQIEIEFRGVAATEGQSFRFWTQGAQDGKWVTGNVWDGALINLYDVPADGVYMFTSTRKISSEMVNVNTFNLGFRCDYWSSGMFRVRNVKIEKGDTVTEWSPGI